MSIVDGRERAAIDLLVRTNALTAGQAEEASRLAALWDSGAISVVLAKGFARPEKVAAALAHACGLRVLDPLATPFDARGFAREHLRAFVSGRFVPWRKARGETLFAVVNPCAANSEIAALLGADHRFSMMVTTETELTAALEEAVGDEVVEEAIYGLSDAAPDLSARRGVTWRQTILITALAVATVYVFSHAPILSYAIASLIAGVFFISTLVFRIALMVASFTAPRRERKRPPQAPSTMPIYTILVALRDEAALLPQIVRALDALDYPATKLDILLLLEAGDNQTRAASRALALDGRFRVLTVPDRLPRTKPKACNYGLAFARGEYVTVYDAEDRPDPAQLQVALAAFDDDPEAQCMQARLGFYNSAENWLTRQFALEFTLWFSFLLPGLARLGLPIPLGGTSNHFRRAALERIGAWDAFNVTEDADIGIRLARSGARVGTIRSVTSEEANCELANWLHQRSRWLKGYLQTWLVHMRSPGRLARELGAVGFWSFQLLVGGAIASALLHLAFWAVLVLRFAQEGPAAFSWSGLAVPWALSVLIGGNGLAIACGVVAALHPHLKGHGRIGLLLSALSMPIYWFLISFAALKALFSLIGRPFYWAKTRHGLSRFDYDFGQAAPRRPGWPNGARSDQA